MLSKIYVDQSTKPEDIFWILDYPWEVTKQELENFGYDKLSKEILADMYLFNNLGYNRTILDSWNNPVAAVGVAKLTNNDWATWFLGSELFPKYKKSVTKALINLNAFICKEEKPDNLYLITSIHTAEAQKWFSFMGFELEDNPFIKNCYDCDVDVYIKK